MSNLRYLTNVSKGNLYTPSNELPRLEAGPFIPEGSATCPQCDTTFVTEKVRECLFCGYKEGRPIDQDKALRYKMKCSERRRNLNDL